MSNAEYRCARCHSPVHDYDESENRAVCEVCEDFVPVVEAEPCCKGCGATDRKHCECKRKERLERARFEKELAK